MPGDGGSVVGGAAALGAAIGGMVLPQPDPGTRGSGDARTLPIRRDADGTRFLSFRDGCKECVTSDFDDWPIPGPRTAKYVITQIGEHAGGSPTQHSQQWRLACKFQASDGPAMEHLEWSKALEAFLIYDQVDLSNLAGVEVICRNLQRLEERYKDKVLSTLDEGGAGDASLYTSISAAGRGGLIIDPKLTDFITTNVARDYQIMKERRKAREERQLARKEKPKDKNKEKE